MRDEENAPAASPAEQRLGNSLASRCYFSKPYFGGCGNETTGPLGVWSGGR